MAPSLTMHPLVPRRADILWAKIHPADCHNNPWEPFRTTNGYRPHHASQWRRKGKGEEKREGDERDADKGREKM